MFRKWSLNRRSSELYLLVVGIIKLSSADVHPCLFDIGCNGMGSITLRKMVPYSGLEHADLHDLSVAVQGV